MVTALHLDQSPAIGSLQLACSDIAVQRAIKANAYVYYM